MRGSRRSASCSAIPRCVSSRRLQLPTRVARICRRLPRAVRATDLVFSAPDADAIAAIASVAFLSVPHTAAMAHGARPARARCDGHRSLGRLPAEGRRRSTSRGTRSTTSRPSSSTKPSTACPSSIAPQLPGARLVACPGCYPTASLLAVAPALEAGIASADHVVIDAKSGVSGRAGPRHRACTSAPSTRTSPLTRSPAIVTRPRSSRG